MTADAPAHAGPRTLDDLLAGLPEPGVVPGALDLLAAQAAERGLRTVVLDDDPTGTQTLHDVPVVTTWAAGEVDWATSGGAGLRVVLTNTRSLPAHEAGAVVAEAAGAVERASERGGWPVRLVSRGDSTLRGHVPLETDVLAAAAERRGRGVDGLLLTPAYLEAGRITVGGVHYAGEDGGWTPVGETEYARDATFGYRSSDLREWLEEKSGGRWAAGDVLSVDLRTIRDGGPEAVTEQLLQLRGGAPAVVDAASEHDLAVVALAVEAAEREGRRLLHRCGPSLVRVMAGLHHRPPLRGDELYPAGARPGHGLVVVGSHTATTTRQVDVLLSSGTALVELDVPALLAGRAGPTVLAGRVAAALADGDVVLATSRELSAGTDGADSLAIAGRVSSALVDVVAAVRRSADLRFVVAKGGITSHDVATRGLGIRRARVIGQVFEGMVSVWSTVDADVGPGLPFVVFAGNVGDATSLARTVEVLDGRGTTPP